MEMAVVEGFRGQTVILRLSNGEDIGPGVWSKEDEGQPKGSRNGRCIPFKVGEDTWWIDVSTIIACRVEA